LVEPWKLAKRNKMRLGDTSLLVGEEEDRRSLFW
jgi:hypothetical protein